MRINRYNITTILLLLLPGMGLYLWLVLNPVLQSLVLSTYKWDTLSTKHFVGLANYKSVFASSLFWQSLKNSLIFMVTTTVFQVLIGFTLGYFVYLQMKGYRLYKTIFFLPTILPSVAVGFIWDHIYSTSMGMFKPLIEAMGMVYHNPLASSKTAIVAVILAQIWASCGVQVIIFPLRIHAHALGHHRERHAGRLQRIQADPARRHPAFLGYHENGDHPPDRRLPARLRPGLRHDGRGTGTCHGGPAAPSVCQCLYELQTSDTATSSR